MPKGKGRPFNKPERRLGGEAAIGHSKRRERERLSLGFGEKVLMKTGLATLTRYGVGKGTKHPKPKSKTNPYYKRHRPYD